MGMKWRSALIAASLSVAAGISALPAEAQLIAADSYLIGSTPAAGQYANNTSLASQGAVTIPGFTNSLGGTGSAQFQSTTSGLAYAPLNVTSTGSGKVTYLNAGLDGIVRSTARNLATPVPVSSTYWVGYLLNRGPITAAAGRDYVLTGFGNATTPVLGAAGPTGLFAGFSGDTGNLVLRYRDTANLTAETVLINASTTNIDNTTLLVVAQINVNVSGITDNVNWWVNPTDFTSVATLNSTAFVTGSLTGNLLSASTDFTRLNYISRNWNQNAFFDEPRLGTTLANTFPVPVATVAPEPASLALLALGGMSFFAARRRRA
jgi:hypothetical protein